MFDLELDFAEPGSPTVLVVEDDAALRTLLMRTLRENGYRPIGAGSGPEMARCLQAEGVDLILLDVMLPGTNGFDLCRAVRRTSDVPVIMLSARGDEADRFLGLELGADDYVPKPFSARELIARIRATLRRATGSVRRTDVARGELAFGGWTLDPARRELLSPEGAAVELSGAEFDLLLAFVSQPQRVIGRERLLELSRARIADASDRSIDVLVSRLRRKLSRSDDKGAIIRTVRGVGYMFALPVERI
ncbi:response regulator [Phenylobacterium deserti]|uniref:Regulatory protein VirG n=1 Tax=Phenylobacterium deserti TaxID=1914756 RepID=A0A328AR34_9CAUL|nr:response regulator transcription factor [Phenylobacterium deserti]RAK57480.1 DNA-binding response regulator [Phenylobacterium deserti]